VSKLHANKCPYRTAVSKSYLAVQVKIAGEWIKTVPCTHGQ